MTVSKPEIALLNFYRASELHGGLILGQMVRRTRDPELILNDWTDAERNALLRRGVFAPSTYGRIRFHHRATHSA